MTPKATGSAPTRAAPAAGAPFEATLRSEGAVVLASLIRWTGDVVLAHDALQDALVEAVARARGGEGFDNLAAWLVATAKRRAIDRMRRERRRSAVERQAALQAVAAGDAQPDDPIRLLFTCCHPTLSFDARVALSLRILGGLDTAEIAAAFLVPEATVARRITRAKSKIREARIPYRVPDDGDLPERLQSVLAVIYLVYTTGHCPPRGAPRADLRSEAVRLVHLILDQLPRQPAVMALAGLILATEARGSQPPLPDAPDPPALLARARRLTRDALESAPPDRYALEAAIACLHAEAVVHDRTDWSQIVYLYRVLERKAPSPIVRVNRAVAEMELFGPGPALAILDDVDGLERWPYLWAARAEALARLGRAPEAATALQRAIAVATNDTDRHRFAARLRSLPA